MSEPREIIAGNLARVQDEMATALVAAGRPHDAARLVGVSKYVDAATTRLLLAAGCRELGESRPQQLWDKASAPGLTNASWHLVGHLQRNKIRRTLAIDPLIHSVDSLRLLRALNDESMAAATQVRVLLEVNCSGEGAKHGFATDDVEAALAAAEPLASVAICGLMTMAAHDGCERTARSNFASLRNLRDTVQSQAPERFRLKELSMGMSGDFASAIVEGATLVRIGSRLFAGLL